MIVAGIGFRAGAPADEIVSLVGQAFEAAALPASRLARLATVEALAGAAAFREAARRLGVPAVPVGPASLAAAAPLIRTRSERSLRAHGVGSVAEAAALGAAGAGSSLVLARISSPAVTCALAERAP